MNLTKVQLAKIKMDNNKFTVALGIDVDLLSMIRDGYVCVAGEKKETGELIYDLTDAGRAMVENHYMNPAKH